MFFHFIFAPIKYFYFVLFSLLLLLPPKFLLGQQSLQPASLPENLMDYDADYIVKTIQKIEKKDKNASDKLSHLAEIYYSKQDSKLFIKKFEEIVAIIQKNYPDSDFGVTSFYILLVAYLSDKDTSSKTIEKFISQCNAVYNKLSKENNCFATRYLLVASKCEKKDFFSEKKRIDKIYKETKNRKCPIATVALLLYKGDFLLEQYDNYGALSARMEAKYVMDSVSLGDKEAFDYNDFSKIYTTLASVHYKVGNYNEAIIYWKKSQDILLKNKITNKRQNIQIANNIGLSYLKNKNYNVAIDYFEKAVQLAKNQKDSVWIGLATGNIGDVLIQEKEYEKAIPYLEIDIVMSKKFKEYENAIATNIAIAGCYLDMKNTPSNLAQAFKYLQEAEKMLATHVFYIKLRSKDEIVQTQVKLYKNWLDYYIKTNNQALTAVYLLKFNAMSDSVRVLKQGEKLSVLQKSYDIEDENSQKRIKQLEIENTSTKNIFIGVVAIFSVFLIIFLSINYQIKRKLISARHKQKMTDLVTESIINKQKIEYLETIGEQNSRITASIEYAKMIQQSILPSQLHINKILENKTFFTIYQPKDIISGDFYWVQQKHEKTIIVLADCTGHGVPGAMMSMLANELLHKETFENNALKPEIILKNIYIMLKKRLNMKETKRYDGMDIAMLVYDKNTKILDFASVGSVCACYVRDNIVNEFPKNKVYVPMLLIENTEIPNFEKFSLELDKKTKFYMFSDGITDQFDEGYKKKFSKKNFLNLIQQTQEMPLDEQKNHIEKVINDWKKDAPQTDDISLLAFEI